MRKDVVIILPAYNEAESIVKVLSGLRDFEVIVVDDGSQDQTAALAAQVGANVISLPQHSGKGAAIRAGIAHALSKFNFDAAILLDSDGQHNPRHIQEFLELWGKRRPDIILGVRDLNSRTTPFLHRAWNKFINFFISILSGRKFSDSQCGFRLLSRYALSKLKLTRHGYEIETEIILEAVKNNLDIVEVSIETIYHNRRLMIFNGMGRAMKIFIYTLIRGTPLLIRRAIFLLQNSVKSQWRWIAFIIFLGLLIITFYQSVEKINIGFIQRQQFLSQELGTALRWLKENSEPDAIIMAHWFRGNQIIAFANRRVVATTKVYPSEAMEVAKRYRDIASFFLNESEEDAKAIAERYGASYVFMDKSFQAGLCKAINRCEYATSNRRALNSVGLARTIAGRMSQGGELRHFHKVWDSPRFIIYKITDKYVGLSLEEKQMAVKIAREVISSLLLEGHKRDPADFYSQLQQKKMIKFFEPRNVDVTIWNDGHVRASRIGVGGSLIDNLVKAASDATHDSRFFPLEKAELKDMRIEVIVFNNDYAPLTADMITANRVDPLKGYRLTHEGRATYFLPEIFVVSRRENWQTLLTGLCRKAGLAKNCYRTNPLEVFDVEDFIENVTHSGIIELSGPISVLGENFSQELLEKRMRLAARWLLAIQKSDGRFVFKIDPITGAESQAPDLPRNALAGQALVEAYNASGDGRYLAAAEKNATYLKNALQEMQQRDKQFKPSLPYLTFGLLQNLALFQATRDPTFRIEAENLADALWSRLENNGSFGGSKIADYQTFFALVQFAKSTNDYQHLDKLTKLSGAYKQRFRQDRILKNNSQSLAVNAWLVNGFKSLYDLTRNQDDADFVFEVASWLADYRFTYGPAAKAGAFFNKPNDRHIYTRGTGKVAEAMVDAYLLAAELKQQYLAEYYQATFAKALNWLMSMQLTEDSAYFVSRKNAFATIGGLRHDLLDFQLWNDSAAHFILAAANYLKHGRGREF